MPPAAFHVGQAILWFAKQTKAGEPQYTVPGFVVKTTPKRIAIRVVRQDATLCIRYVTSRRLQAAKRSTP